MTRLEQNASAGQTRLSPGAQREVARPLTSPIYYAPYIEAELTANRLLQELLGTQQDVLVITGNATHGIEASLLGLLEPNDSMITLNAGVFGQLMTDLVSAVGGVPIEIRVPYGKTPDLSILERALLENPGAKAVGVVHTETSTGVDFPLPEIARLVHEYDRLLVVDAVSSLATVEFHMDEWGVDACIGSGQKSLNAPQGLAIVGLSKRAWRTIDERASPITGACLDLKIWRLWREEEVVKLGQAYITGQVPEGVHYKVIHRPSPSASLMFALVGALQDVFDEGLDRVFMRHHVASAAVRAGVRALGLEVLADERVASSAVTAFYLPENVDEFQLRQQLFEDHGVALGWGPVELGLHATRIGNMGRAAHPQVQLPVLEALGTCLAGRGHNCRAHEAVKAAKAVFEAADDSLWNHD